MFLWSLPAGGAALLGASATSSAASHGGNFAFSPLLSAGVTLLLAPAPLPTLASGTTLAALQAGSLVRRFVVAIEGLPYLLTDATPQQAIDAWYDHTATHFYTDALDGLFVNLENVSTIDPNDPITRGGSCALTVVEDSTRGAVLAVSMAKRNAGNETALTATVDRNDATLNVQSAAAFDASGDAWMGTECVGYTGTTASSFTGCTRGKYVPFVNGNTGVGFGEHHRVGTNELDVKLPSYVTSDPREWIGRWVGVWCHKLEGGALNSRADAQLVYAGRIASHRDAPNNAVQIELKHVLDSIIETTIGGRDMWRAEIPDRVYLLEDMTFRFKEGLITGASSSVNTANDLVVVASGASGANEIDEGVYTLAELFGFINGWLASELAAARLAGTHSIGILPDGDRYRVRLFWELPGSGNGSVSLGMPQGVRVKLGYDMDDREFGVGSIDVEYATSDLRALGEQHSIGADHEYLRSLFILGTNQDPDSEMLFENEDGTFKDQYAYIPASDRPASDGGYEWGVFLVDERILIFGAYDGAASKIRNARIMSLLGQSPTPNWYRIPAGPGLPETTRIRQVWRLEMTRGQWLKRSILSTGTSTYNHATHDTLSVGLGVGCPAEIAGAAFEASIDALPGADLPIVVSIDKPTPFRDVVATDLHLMRAFLRWHNGGLEFATWQAPHASLSVAALEEANKAAPIGTNDHHRSVTVEDGTWARPKVTVRYNRDFNSSGDGGDGYRDSFTIVDSQALDANGGEGATLELRARNTYSDFQLTGAGVETLAPGYIASAPLFTRPARLITRSIDARFAEGLAAGHAVTLTDEFARDPDTGLRGVTAMPAIVVAHRATWGGWSAPPPPGAETPPPMGCEVTLMALYRDRLAVYGPCADVDETYGTGGLDTNLLKVHAHRYSETTEATDVTRFAVGDLIRIIERDPADPTNPEYRDVEVELVEFEGSNILTLAAEPAALDANKRYRVVFRDYATAVTSQRAYAFQADDADGRVADLRAPYEFAVGNAEQAYTAWAATDEVELPPDLSYGDGVSYDCGHDQALARLCNNLINVKTCRQNPTLTNTVMDGTGLGVGATWRLVQVVPVHLGDETLLNDYWRRISVAPWLRSSDGTSASVRVSLSRTYPNANSLDDVGMHVQTVSSTWTTTSTTWATGAADVLACNVKGLDGIAWLMIECTAKAETRGLAKLVESGRLYP